MKKALIFLLMFALLIPFAACDGKEQKHWDKKEGKIAVGFSQVSRVESDWRKANTASMEETFSEENGYDFILKDAQQKHDTQIKDVRWFIREKADFIVIAPIQENGWDAVLAEAKEAGIPVIIVDRMVSAPDNLYTCWVGSDFENEGSVAVKWMEDNLDADLKIVHLQGTMGSSAQIGRTKGIEKGFKNNSGWEKAHQITGNFAQADGKAIIETLIMQNTGFNVIYCENDNMAFGAIEALDAEKMTYGKDGDIKIISFDATKEGLKKTLAGKINFNVECNPMHGPRVDDIIKKLIKNEVPEKKIYVEEASFDAATITQDIIDKRPY